MINKPNVKIANPITADYDTMRNGLLCGLLMAVSNNEKRGYPDLNLFELGTVFDGDMPGHFFRIQLIFFSCFFCKKHNCLL